MTQKLFGILLITAFLSVAFMTGTMLSFVFFYPLFMSFIWIIGGTYFYYHWERHNLRPETLVTFDDAPMVSIIIPCYNEALNIHETIEAAHRQNYENYEIVAINDGSKDETGAILDKLAKKYTKLRIVHLAENQGKAMALRTGALVSKGEYIVCIDGDALLDVNATAHLVKPMVENPRVGAVTGNPRVRTRSTILGKIQVGEFSSIIGLIKRSQRIYGHIFTVSGVIAAFRKRALHECGYWDVNMMTEDIDISWRLQLKHWQIQYQPSALCWILMPETLRGLWRQRLRWAQGGAEVFFKNITKIWAWNDHRMWMLILDFCLSATWAYSYLISIILWSVGRYIVPLPEGLNVPTIWPPVYWGLVLASVNLMQMASALIIERRYDYRLLSFLGWTIWYPIVFWVLSFFTTLCGIPKALFKSSSQRAQWGSSDRGFR